MGTNVAHGSKHFRLLGHLKTSERRKCAWKWEDQTTPKKNPWWTWFMEASREESGDLRRRLPVRRPWITEMLRGGRAFHIDLQWGEALSWNIIDDKKFATGQWSYGMESEHIKFHSLQIHLYLISPKGSTTTSTHTHTFLYMYMYTSTLSFIVSLS